MYAGINQHTFWILKPDGTITEREVPEIHGGWHHFLPLRSGVFASGGSINVKKQRDPGNRGAYWLESDQIQKIAGGFVNATAVSPDGCKVVFVREPHDNLPTANRSTLHLIDTCKGA
jgi:hypothetical protein